MPRVKGFPLTVSVLDEKAAPTVCESQEIADKEIRCAHKLAENKVLERRTPCTAAKEANTYHALSLLEATVREAFDERGLARVVSAEQHDLGVSPRWRSHEIDCE